MFSPVVSGRILVKAACDILLLLLALLIDRHMLMQGGGVPPTVHILVHLLGDLLRVAEVRRCHRHPEK